MKNTLFAATSLCLLTISQSARADLSLSGAVGLPLNPTAQTLSSGQVQVQGNYEQLGNLSVLGFDVSKVKNYGLHVAGTLGNRLELSGGFNSLRASDPAGLNVDELNSTGLSLGAKYLLTQAQDAQGIGIAVGAAYDRALFHNEFVYLVASKPLPVYEGFEVPIVLHLGARYDRFSTADIGGPKSKKASVYGGIEFPLTPRGDFTLTGEVGSKNNDLGREVRPYSVGVHYGCPISNVSASIGVQRQGVTGDGGIYARIAFKR